MARLPAPLRPTVVRDAFRSQLWPVPLLAVVLAVVLGVALPALDARVDDSISGSVWAARLFGGGPDAARSVLSAIAGSLITMTSLTFSLTVVSLQLASGQFSPRLLRTFTSDRFVHVTLGLFLATFVYALTVLRAIRTESSDQVAVVPRIAVTFSFVLALASVLALVLFLAHLARELRVETMLRRVQDEARTTVRRAVPERDGPVEPVPLPTPPRSASPLLLDSSGFLTSVDEQALLEAAEACGAVLLLERPLGSSIIAETPVGWAWAVDGGPLQDPAALRGAVCSALALSHEPTGAQDVAFGLRQLTDVASKALSPGINDPRTAIHALSHSAGLLCTLADRVLGPTAQRDEQDRVRVVWAQPELGDLLDLALSGPRRYGASDPDVLARLFALLAEVAWVTQDDRQRAAVEGQRARLVALAQEQDVDDTERASLQELDQTVRAALRGEHRSPAHAVGG